MKYSYFLYNIVIWQKKLKMFHSERRTDIDKTTPIHVSWREDDENVEEISTDQVTAYCEYY